MRTLEAGDVGPKLVEDALVGLQDVPATPAAGKVSAGSPCVVLELFPSVSAPPGLPPKPLALRPPTRRGRARGATTGGESKLGGSRVVLGESLDAILDQEKSEARSGEAG